MPSIAKIRLTNVIFEEGAKRFNDLTLQFDGHNGVILLENGGGKTVFIQAALQVILPHTDLGKRKIKNTLSLENGPCHLAIEWILNEQPRRYGLTAVSLFLNPRGQLDSYRYVYEYDGQNSNQIDDLPFVKTTPDGKKRPAGRGEIRDYYQYMQADHMGAHTFQRIRDYWQYLEEHLQIIPNHWRNIQIINGKEGGVEDFFENCPTTEHLVEQLLIPVVEKAMAGKGTKDFVQTFQQQREHFKKHKQLRTRIEESQQIELGLNEYVNLFKKMHLAEQQLMEQKELVKAIWTFWQKETAIFAQQLKELEDRWTIWQEEKAHHHQKKESWQLAQLEKKKQAAGELYEQLALIHSRLTKSLARQEKDLQNLTIAELKLKMKTVQERIQLYQKQLHSLTMDQETATLQKLFWENTSFLKGYFLQEEQGLRATVNALTGQQQQQKGLLAQQREELTQLRNQLGELTRHQIRTETNIERTEQDLGDIAKDILANPLHEKVKEEQPQWKARITSIQEQTITYRNLLRHLASREEELRQDIAKFNKEIGNLQQSHAITELQLTNMEKEEQALLLQLGELRPDWYYFSSVYQRQATILEYLTEKVETTRRQRERLLREERFAYRLLDDYGSQEYFMAEPLLAQLVSRWSSQFNLLAGGSQYLENGAQTLGISVNQLYKQYPLWPLTLITSVGELDKITAKLKEQASNLSFPILLLTDEEARQILQEGKEVTERYVFPTLWNQNIDSADFNAWQEVATSRSQEAAAETKAKEQELASYTKLLENARDYFTKYPFEDYTRLQQDHRQSQEELEQKKHLLSQKERKLEQIIRDHKQYTGKAEELNQEALHLGHKLQKANLYFQKLKQKEQETLELQSVKHRLQAKTLEEARQKILMEERENSLLELEKRLTHGKMELSRLVEDPLYKEVMPAEPIATSLTRIGLEEKRQYLRDALNKKLVHREIIETELKHCQASKEEGEKNLSRVRKQAAYPIDETLVFPPYGELEMENLMETIQELKAELKEIGPAYQKKKDIYEKYRHEYEIRREDFLQEFPKIIFFTEPLAEVELALAKEKRNLTETKEYLNTREKQLSQEKQEVDTALMELRAKNERYEFLLTTIKEIDLPASWEAELPYQRAATTTRFVQKLEKLSKQLQEKEAKLEGQKEIFLRFCEKQVLDFRMREAVVNGIRTRKAYDEVIDWQQKLRERIARSIEIAEQDLRDHDLELQQFIHYLHTHVATLAQELRLIPRNTRLRVDDTWKEIFVFDIPNWDEGAGKEELRKYMDWMLAQLEENRYLNVQGQEDHGLIRKQMENWFQSKQLLQYVLKGKEIRIRCRKVTNEGQVSNSYFSWETSNMWSGGEKWSKNMALFLGIQNYIAEKKHPIDLKQKRQRTVIMDNPFGKASSDHILFPVFFIAEQLGFQFIALTAHGEGRFIRDYFPIVYSCKLRPAVGRAGSVVTAEKNISYAFFQDHNPQALSRLEEREQLSLMDW